jgi:pyruvate/2-oxoglutarate dehydrogenase complex dihydrolipoamide dehydrogenase (E3) component
MARPYDFVAIGGGSAGFNAARVAASVGMRTAVIDGARTLGGLCILRGCMPSKTLIYSAEVLHLAREGAAFGLRIGGASADMRAVQARKRRLIAEFARDRVKQLTGGKFDLIRGNARFVDSRTVDVGGGQTVRAKHFLIGTGSRVSVPDVPGLAATPFWTSDDVLELDRRPPSVIALGGGIVACELAQFLNRVGTKVCLIQRSRTILRGHSPEASAVVMKAFSDEGIEVHTDTTIEGIRRSGRGIEVVFRHKGRLIRRRAAHLFNAMGREPDTAALNLAAAGVKTDGKGRIVTNRWQQTSAPNIYAAGDCCGPHEIVHVAIQQAELAAQHSAGCRKLRPVSRIPLLSVVFTDPQLATIGLTEKELREQGVKYLAASHPFNDHGKSMLMNALYGFVKVLAEPRRGRILGAEIVGKDAGELIHCFTTAITLRATVHDMLRSPWYHPTLAEIVTYPLEDIADRVGPVSKHPAHTLFP